MINKALLCCLLLAFVPFISAEGCKASVTLVERPGSWSERGQTKTIYDMQIHNTGSCAFEGTVGVDVKTAPGSFVGYSWGYSKHGTANVGSVAAGQSVSGFGFILSGEGTPSATITAFGNCACAEPTPAPTDAPNQPTPTPTMVPTQPPDDGVHIYVAMKFLILACTADDIRVGVATTTIEAVGSQYDILVASTYGSGPLDLTYSAYSAKYYAIIAATALKNCWNQDQVAAVTAYQNTFNVKLVTLYSNLPVTGITSSPVLLDPAVDASFFTLAPALSTPSAFLNPAAKIPTAFEITAYPGTITDAAQATAAAYVTVNGVQSVIAAFLGTKQLDFFVDQAGWALFPSIFGHAWFEWVSNGIFAGARRIELNAHMDDIFMATGMYDPATKNESETDLYRIVPADLQSTADWQTALNARLPAGSNFTLTFPFNGATVVLEKKGYLQDALYKKAKTLRDKFIWETHTWSHPYLDEMDYDGVKEELTLNHDTALDLFGSEDKLANNPLYCYNSMITPSITGLFNGEALQAMWDYGIRYVVGDNSRPELIPDNLYHGIHSKLDPHGFVGMYYLPRHATNIYYDGSLPEHIENQYNDRYSAQFGILTFDQIIAKEAETTVNFLIKLRHDPYMFHQANLRYFTHNSKSQSLLSAWTDAVADLFLQYLNLPLISRNHDELAKVFLAREERDACEFQGTLKINQATKQIVGLNAFSQNKCQFGVSGVKASGANVARYETYGCEETTWFNMPGANGFDVTLDTAVTPL